MAGTAAEILTFGDGVVPGISSEGEAAAEEQRKKVVVRTPVRPPFTRGI
ncbi:hypothetical protein [Nakamurella antarctica]|nr:hypothetical protein [Nakamurella antarctica]